jgi:hypothetical protein
VVKIAIALDLTGREFGNLTVIKKVPSNNNEVHKKAMWLCHCNCKLNNNIIVNSYDLRSGKINSCGCLKNLKISKINRKNHKGETKYNSWGSKMEIIEYNGANHITVEFEKPNCIMESSYRSFKIGNILSPYDITTFGVGYLGEGNTKTHINGKCTKAYNTWNGMLERCYSTKAQKKQPTYKGCSVCIEWHNYHNFLKWYDENYYEIKDQRMCLDKDILHKGNKIYAPENCIFVPNNINTLFTKTNAKRGIYPIGVYYKKKNKSFVAQCKTGELTIKGKKVPQKYLGLFNTSIEAFYAYKKYKEQIIKDVANTYKQYIPQKLYDALCSYIVEITD